MKKRNMNIFYTKLYPSWKVSILYQSSHVILCYNFKETEIRSIEQVKFSTNPPSSLTLTPGMTGQIFLPGALQMTAAFPVSVQCCAVSHCECAEDLV